MAEGVTEYVGPGVTFSVSEAQPVTSRTKNRRIAVFLTLTTMPLVFEN